MLRVEKGEQKWDEKYFDSHIIVKGATKKNPVINVMFTRHGNEVRYSATLKNGKVVAGKTTI